VGAAADGSCQGLRVVFCEPETGQEWSLRAEDIGLRVDVEATLDRALAVGRAGGPLDRLASLPVVSARGITVAPAVSVDPGAAEALLSEIAAEVAVISRNVSLDPETGQVREGSPGRLLDSDATISNLTQAVGRLSEENPLRVEVAVRIVPPAGDPAQLATLARRRLSTFSTRFSTSETGRAWNILLASASIDGRVLPPGGRLSFNQVVGPRTAGRGYRRAPEIIDNELVPGIGGGVCQVATTLFNAALLADLDVVVRHQHSRPLSYIGLGRDATVSYPALDLVIENPKAFSVVVTAYARGDTLEVSFWGRETIETRVTLEVEEFNLVPAACRSEFDPELPPGASREEEPSFHGRDVRLWRVVTQLGRVIRRELLFVDHYDPIEGLVRVGPPAPDEAGAAEVSLEPPATGGEDPAPGSDPSGSGRGWTGR